MEKRSKVQSQIQAVASRKLEAIALKSNQSNLHVQVNPKCSQGPSEIAKLLPGQFTSNDCKKEHQGNCYGVTYNPGCTFSSWWIGFCPPLSPHQRVANLDPWAPLPCGFSLSWKRLQSLTMLHCLICAVSSDKTGLLWHVHVLMQGALHFCRKAPNSCARFPIPLLSAQDQMWTHSKLLQEFSVVARSHRARAVLRRRVGLATATILRFSEPQRMCENCYCFVFFSCFFGVSILHFFCVFFPVFFSCFACCCFSLVCLVLSMFLFHCAILVCNCFVFAPSLSLTSSRIGITYRK